jgi:class 3 adenylate cyclase
MNRFLPFGKTQRHDLRKVVKIEFDNGYSLNVLQNQLPFTIGRAADCNLVISSSFVSRAHCTIEAANDGVHMVDQSANGTFIDDHMLKNKSASIDHLMHLLFGGEFMLTISPYDKDGALIGTAANVDTTTDSITHGICLVDVCDSTEKTPEQVANITQALRIDMLRKNRGSLLLIKNTGDGFLLIYEDPVCALETALHVLNYQNLHGKEDDFDIRVTLDAGITTQTADKDRLGIAINRAARIEKVQAGNIEERGPCWDRLKVRNRCILTVEMERVMVDEDRVKCEHIGACRLKGFGEKLHEIFQYVT